MKHTVPQRNAAVAVFDTPADAVSAVTTLEKSGFDLRKLSVAGRDERNNGVVGYYKAGDRIKYWGKQCAVWGCLWSVLFGWAFFVVPGIGPILVAGPLANWIVTALENAAIFGSLSILGAALYSIGIPKETVVKYEAALKANKFLVVAHGTAQEVDNARMILHLTDTLESAA